MPIGSTVVPAEFFEERLIFLTPHHLNKGSPVGEALFSAHSGDEDRRRPFRKESCFFVVVNINLAIASRTC